MTVRLSCCRLSCQLISNSRNLLTWHCKVEQEHRWLVTFTLFRTWAVQVLRYMSFSRRWRYRNRIATSHSMYARRQTPFSYSRYKLSPHDPENRRYERCEWLNADYSQRGLMYYKLGAVADPFLTVASSRCLVTGSCGGDRSSIPSREP